jgi:hypothetical protein
MLTIVSFRKAVPFLTTNFTYLLFLISLSAKYNVTEGKISLLRPIFDETLVFHRRVCVFKVKTLIFCCPFGVRSRLPQVRLIFSLVLCTWLHKGYPRLA